MSYPSPSLCRVAVHSDVAHVDLTLPTEVPVAALVPCILDILNVRAGSGTERRGTPAGAAYRLSRPGTAALDGSKTLAQHHIHDGAVLLLTCAPAELPAPRFDDPAEKLAATVRAEVRPWTPRTARFTAILAVGWLGGLGVAVLACCGRGATAVVAAALGCGGALVAAMFAHRAHRDGVAALTLGLLAVVFAAAAGLVAVPGRPGAPNALLAATAAFAAAVLAVQLADCGGPVMTAVCCLTALGAAGPLAVVLAQVSPQVAGAATAAVSLGLLQVAARVSMACTGLARSPDDHGAVRAHNLLTGLVVAFSAAAALGAAAAAVQTGRAPGIAGVAFTAVCGAALLLRTRAHTDRSQIIALVIGAIAALSSAWIATAAAVPQHPVALCLAGAVLVGAAAYLSLDAHAWSPAVRRGVELLEYPVLAAVVPVACWVCGCYGAARGLSPA